MPVKIKSASEKEADFYVVKTEHYTFIISASFTLR